MEEVKQVKNTANKKYEDVKERLAGTWLGQLADTFFGYTYFDFRIRNFLAHDFDIGVLVFAGIQLFHMIVYYAYVTDKVGGLVGKLAGHSFVEYTIYVGTYIVARRMMRHPIIGLPVVFITSAMTALVVVEELLDPPDVIWFFVALIPIFVFLTSLHMSMYVDVYGPRPTYREMVGVIKGERKTSRRVGVQGANRAETNFNEEGFKAICSAGVGVEELIEKAKEQVAQGEQDIVFTRCRQAVEKSLKVLYYYKKREYPGDLNEAINGVNTMVHKGLTEEELQNIHQFRKKANKAIHNSSQDFAEWEILFAIEQTEKMYERVKEEIGGEVF